MRCFCKNKNPKTTLVDDINYKLSYKITNKKTKYSFNSVFISLICKFLYLIGKLLNCIIFSIREIFIYLDDAKESSETIEISSINKLKIYQIKDYIYNNYYVKSNRAKTINRERLLKDLVVFKAYKEDLEINIKNNSLIKDIFTMDLSIIAICVSMYSFSQRTYSNDIIINATNIPTNALNKIVSANNSNSVNLAKDDLSFFGWIGFALIIISAFLVLWFLIKTGKKSDSSRLKVVNYGIHTLEAIKEEKERKGNK